VEARSWLHRYVEVAHGRAEDRPIELAFELILNRDHRDVLTAYFFSRADIGHIMKVTEIPPDVLDHFRRLVADLSVVRHKLEHRSWAEKYYREQANSDTGASLVRGAILYGPAFLDNHIKLGIETPLLNVKEYAARMLQQAYHMAMLATGSDPASPVSTEALKWYKAATSMLTAYSSLDTTDDARTEALVAIKKHRETKTPQDLGIDPSDVLN